MENKPFLNDQEESEKMEFEKELMQTIKDGNFEEIENMVTPRAFQKCESNSLLMAMKVNFEIRKKAEKMGPDKQRFNQLADTVEEFIATLLDPLRSDEDERKLFGDHILDDVLEEAFENEQKKFFTHPVVHEEMNRKWYGRKFNQREWKWWQRLLFGIWCLLDLVFSPILLLIFSIMKAREESKINGKNAPAGIVILPKSQTVRVGDRVEFKCEEQKSGNPIASTAWYKGREKLDEKGPILVIENVQESDKGTYTCVVNNTAGEDDRLTTTLSVDPLYLIYLDYLKTPYYKFRRDTLNYIILLSLHFGLCLAPSAKTISGLEWTIFVFFVGIYLVERKQRRFNLVERIQLRKPKTRSLRDYWNFLDFISLMVYLGIFLLRAVTTIIPGSVANNRALAFAGYLYGLNTLCLSLRTFVHVMEQSQFFTTIQLALFSILTEIQIILGKFMVVLLAFSFTLTKIYTTEKSFLATETDGNDNACSNYGVSCWWSIFIHLGWSLLGQSEELDRLASADQISETVTQICYVAFLIIGVLLLVGMLIALLTHSYEKTQANAFKEWSFQRAITIRTYDVYDPIPVPLNIIYNIISMLLVKRGSIKTSNGKGQKGTIVSKFFKDLEDKYFEKYTNLFPVTDANKLDLVLKETERNRQMVSDILNTTFTLCDPTYKLPAWKVHSSIRIEGLLLTCEGKNKEKLQKQATPESSWLTKFCRKHNIAEEVMDVLAHNQITSKSVFAAITEEDLSDMGFLVGQKILLRRVVSHLRQDEDLKDKAATPVGADLLPPVHLQEELSKHEVEFSTSPVDTNKRTETATTPSSAIPDSSPSSSTEEFQSKPKRFPGARHRTAFSSVSPHFEVVILEMGKKGQLGIGVVNDNYDNEKNEDMPGWKPNSLGYHTSDGEIFYNGEDGKKTKGHAMARRGDLIRCTMEEGKRDDEVSFSFTLNGRMISTQDENSTSFALKKDDAHGLYPYIAMADGCSVLARMCSLQCANEEYETCQYKITTWM